MDPNRTYEIARCVSKNGDLGLVSNETMQWAWSLLQSEKIALYCQVRDQSQRLESEWRDEFATRIEIAESMLPKGADETTNIVDFLMWAVNHEDRGEVMDTLAELLEEATDDDIKIARRIIVQTAQEDLLPIVDEHQD